MTDAVRQLTRQQLSQFLRDHQAIRTFERMQATALVDTPADVAALTAALEDASVLASTVDSRLSDAIASSNRLAEAIEALLAAAPAREAIEPDDLSPPARCCPADDVPLPPVVIAASEDVFAPAPSELIALDEIPAAVREFVPEDNLAPPPLPLTGGMLATIIGGALATNPTGTVGLSAVNGTATTYMRSDAAPALSQAITPTWTAQHTFTAASGAVVLANTAGPILRMSDTDAAANQKHVRIRVVNGSLSISAEDDTLAGAAVTLFATNRSAAAWTALTFGNATDNPTYSFAGTGTATFDGQVTALRFVPTSSTAATNGIYLPAANTVGMSANSTLTARYTSTTFETILQTIFSGTISPAQLTANTDDWAPTGLSGSTVIRASTDASRNLTGVTGGAAGRLLVIINVGSNPLVLVNDSTSTAANRFLLASATNTTLQAGGACILWYDGTSSRWRQITRVA